MTIADQISDTVQALELELREAESRVRRLQRAIDALRDVQPTALPHTLTGYPAPPARAMGLNENRPTAPREHSG